MDKEKIKGTARNIIEVYERDKKVSLEAGDEEAAVGFQGRIEGIKTLYYSIFGESLMENRNP